MIKTQINKKYFFIVSLSIIILMSASFWWFWRIQHDLILAQAKEHLRTIFTTLVSTHHWNVSHIKGPVKKNNGGEYVSAAKQAETNRGNEEAVSGDMYSMMLNRFSGYAEKNRDFTFRLISLKPFESANMPNEMERRDLLAFERGVKEIFHIEMAKDTKVLHYTAPLYAEEKCLECHRTGGYKVGGVLGAISILKPVEDTFIAMKKNKISMIVYSALMLFIITIILYSWSRKLEKYYRQTQLLLVESEKNRVVAATVVTLNHEINNALTTICGESDMLASEADKNDPLKKRYEKIKDSAKHIAELIKKISDIEEVRTKKYLNNISMLDLEEEKDGDEL